MNNNDKMKQILNQTEKRFNDILEYYNDFKDLKNDKYFTQHSIVISLTLLEIKKIKENFDTNTNNKVFNIPQYSFKYKKKFIDTKKIDKNIVKNFLENIGKIRDKLENLIGKGTICGILGISVYDDICDLDNDYIINIIRDIHDSNFHEFYLNYLQEFIKQKANNNNFTKDNLLLLKIVKYITQILIFIKLFIKYKIEKVEPLTNEVIKEISLNEEKSMVNFSLILISNTTFKVEDFLSDDNDKSLNELTNFYKVILKIIKKFEKN